MHNIHTYMNRIDITLSQLEALLAVAKNQSFTRAATQLGMSQSAVSHAVATLERQLDVKLLDRSAGGASVRTPAVRLLEHAQIAVAAIDRLRTEAAGLRNARSGALRIGTFPSATIRIIPRLLGEFKRTYPGIEPVLCSGTGSQIKHWLTVGIVDVGFVELPVSGIEVVASFEDELLAVVPRASPEARRRALTIQELRGFPMLISQYGCEPLIEAAHRRAKVSRRIDMEVRDMATLLAMVREGIGCTLLSRLALPESLQDVVAIPIAPRQTRRLGLALCAAPHRTALQELFVKASLPLVRQLSLVRSMKSQVHVQ
jgi:DNA-binding transcriptional LysR family regulator